MKKVFLKIKDFLIDILFPRFCLGCGKEGTWLCEDCLALLEIRYVSNCPVCLSKSVDFKICKNCKSKTKLSGLLWATSHQNLLVKKLIRQFKYEPFIKELSGPLAYIIISHLLLIEFPDKISLKDFVLVPIPLYKKRLRWRGFNQAEEIAKEIGDYFKIPVFNNILARETESGTRAELDRLEISENIKDVFSCQNENLISGKKIFLVDDFYATGSTIEEATKTLKSAGAKEVWGLVVARG